MKKGWEYKKLGDIANDMYRGSGIKREQVTDTGIPCVRYGEIYTTYNIAFDKCASHTNEEIISSPKYFETGDILFAITGESVEEIGKSIAYLGKEKCMCGGDIVVMKHSQYPKYLSYALSSPKAIKQKGLGKTKLKVVHTNIPSLKEISIPIPPLSEQKEIVEYLDSSFAKIDKLKENAAKNLEEAKALFQSALKDALEPKEGWEEKTMDEVCILSQGLAINSKTKHLLVEKSSIPLLRIKDMKDGTREIFVDDKNYPPKCLAHPDELIYTRTGTLGLIFTGMFGIVHNNCFKIKLDEKILNKYYYMYFVGSDNFRNMILSIASRAAQPDITHKLFKVQKIQFPTLSEQQSIVSFLDSLNEKVNTLQQNYSRICNECDALKQAILRQVFE